jgi:hypothetical protein
VLPFLEHGTAAPSPSTSPLRSFAERLAGRRRIDGSLRSRAFAALPKPACRASTALPLRPRASPRAPLRILSHASPIATADDEHAVENVKFGPERRYSMPVQDAAALFIAISTVYGLMRSELSRYSVL